ncbi:MAG: ammonium transporter [Actinomycetota bacterium]
MSYLPLDQIGDNVRTRAPKYLLGALFGAGAATLLLGANAYADSGQDALDAVGVLGQQTSLLWIILGAVLVIFMPAGFALVETGFTQKKNAGEVMSTNFAIFGLGFVGFLFIGFPLAFSGFSYGAFGLSTPMNGNGLPAVGGEFTGIFYWGYSHLGDGATPALLGFMLYMVAFMDTVATIPTGSMAERWKWKSFVWWGLFCGAFYYPLFAAWTWGGGWLAKSWETLHLGAGYVDFAGSGVVHAVGGVAALAGAIVLGPRIGKFSADGKARAIPGHNIPMAILGCFVLLFGWFGFNAASTFASTDVQFSTVAANTAIAGALGSIAAMYYITWRTGKPDPGMMVNGMLGGLVAITAPCAFVAPWAAAVIGVVAGILAIEGVFFLERRKIDDPVGAVAVHGFTGTFGVLAVGIFANGKYGAGWNGSSTTGVAGIIKGEWGQLGAQALGAITIWTVIFGVAFGFFKIQNKITKGGIRSPEEDEIMGLDLPEMGVLGYND